MDQEAGSKANPKVDAYIQAAPQKGQAQLRQLYKILKSVAPDAEETIKWGAPFFVEPRFLFAFSAHKAHLGFAPTAGTMKAFQEELKQHAATRNTLKVAYNEPLPEDLIRRMAEHCVREVSAREDDSFW